MKRIISVILAAAVVMLCLCGCGKKTEPREVITEKYSGTAADYFADVSSVQGFTCLYSLNGGEQHEIQGKPAGSVYDLIKEKMKSAQEIAEEEHEDTGISLVFKNDIRIDEAAGAEASENIKVRYYGAITVFADDTLSFSGSPDATVKLYYKIPSGTYDSVAEKLNLN